MVELGVLADGLAGCAKCRIPLYLTHAVDILHCGLGAFLRVMCQNTTCQPYGEAAWADLGCKYKTSSRYDYTTGTYIYIICKLMPVNSRNVCTYMHMCSCMLLHEFSDSKIKSIYRYM